MLYLSVKFYLFKEQLKVIWFFYKDISFALMDVFFHFIHFFSQNPYRICRKYHQKNSAGIYGETPLTTLRKICYNCSISPNDRIIDLGCGRGRSCLFFSKICKASVKGIELVPSFVKKANKISKCFRLKNCSFLKEDFFQTDFSNATVLYLYATQLEDEKIKILTQKLQKLPKGAKVISISYPISEYGKSFQKVKKFPVSFPWGDTYGYLCIKGDI